MSHTGGQRSPTPSTRAASTEEAWPETALGPKPRGQEPECVRGVGASPCCSSKSDSGVSACLRAVWSISEATGASLGVAPSLPRPSLQPAGLRPPPSHPARPPLSPQATVRQAACPAHPLLHHPSPPCRVSSGRTGTPCCSWLCAPQPGPGQGLASSWHLGNVCSVNALGWPLSCMPPADQQRKTPFPFTSRDI